MELREVVDVIDLEQDIKVLVDGAEVYSGPLEEMSAGQLLLLQDCAILSLKCDSRLIVSLESDEM